MFITRRDNCTVCRVRTSERREFVVTANLFDPDGSGITPEIKKQIIAWRETPLYCDKHRRVEYE